MPNAMTERFCRDLVNEAERFAREVETYASAAHRALARAQAPDGDRDVSEAISNAQRARAALLTSIRAVKDGGP